MKEKAHRLRLIVVALFFILLLLTLIWRVVNLTVINSKFLKGQGNARSMRIQTIPAYRGMITDRHGVPLAISTPVQSLWVNPKTFSPTLKQMRELASLCNISLNFLQKILKRSQDHEFVFIKRQLNPVVAKKIEQLMIPGVNFQQEHKRYYPEAESMAQLLGFTNIDDVGIEGLELAYQDWLRGVPGKKRVVKDRTCRIIEDLGMLEEPRSGRDLNLSIDRRIQYLAYHELQKTVEKFSASSGSVVVLDANSGEILAAANSPSFNPNDRGHYARDSYRNKAMTDTFEPGSVIKPFSVASALSSGLVKSDTSIDTSPSWMMVQGRMIRDIRNYGVLTVAEILQHSSNIGVSKMVLRSPPEQYIDLLQRSGFSKRTDSGFPGEGRGNIVRAEEAKPFVLATLSFGYGISVTALQLAQGYLIFANKGKFLPVTLLHRTDKAIGEKVIDAKIASHILDMLEGVLGDSGTGKQARIPGFRVAGKTGTARIAGKSGYRNHRHVASFAGIAPVSNPRLVVVVVIYEPKKNSYYGGVVAAPLFKEVMAGALRILDVLPDEENLHPKKSSLG